MRYSELMSSVLTNGEVLLRNVCTHTPEGLLSKLRGAPLLSTHTSEVILSRIVCTHSTKSLCAHTSQRIPPKESVCTLPKRWVMHTTH